MKRDMYCLVKHSEHVGEWLLVHPVGDIFIIDRSFSIVDEEFTLPLDNTSGHWLLVVSEELILWDEEE